MLAKHDLDFCFSDKTIPSIKSTFLLTGGYEIGNSMTSKVSVMRVTEFEVCEASSNDMSLPRASHTTALLNGVPTALLGVTNDATPPHTWDQKNGKLFYLGH